MKMVWGKINGYGITISLSSFVLIYTLYTYLNELSDYGTLLIFIEDTIKDMALLSVLCIILMVTLSFFQMKLIVTKYKQLKLKKYYSIFPAMQLIIGVVSSILLYILKEFNDYPGYLGYSLFGIKHYQMLSIMYYCICIAVVIYVLFFIYIYLKHYRKKQFEEMEDTADAVVIWKEKLIYVYLVVLIISIASPIYIYNKNDKKTFEINVSDYLGYYEHRIDDSLDYSITLTVYDYYSQCERKAITRNDSKMCNIKEMFVKKEMIMTSSGLEDDVRINGSSFEIHASYDEEVAETYGLIVKNPVRKVEAETIEAIIKKEARPYADITCEELQYLRVMSEAYLVDDQNSDKSKITYIQAYYVGNNTYSEIVFLYTLDDVTYKVTQSIYLDTEVSHDNFSVKEYDKKYVDGVDGAVKITIPE